MKKGKKWNILGCIVGVLVIILGIWFVFTPVFYLPLHTEGIAHHIFGGDFYTYEFEATRAAAVNAGQAVSYIYNLGEKMALYGGLSFIIAGILIILHYGKCLSNIPKKDKNIDPTALIKPEYINKNTQEEEKV